MLKELSSKGLANKRLVRLLFIAAVFAVLLVGVTVVGAVTSPVTSPTTAPFEGDDRVCGDQPGVYAQTAAIYPVSDSKGNSSSLLAYEVNDNGVGTLISEIPNNDTINNALTGSCRYQRAGHLLHGGYLQHQCSAKRFVSVQFDANPNR